MNTPAWHLPQAIDTPNQILQFLPENKSLLTLQNQQLVPATNQPTRGINLMEGPIKWLTNQANKIVVKLCYVDSSSVLIPFSLRCKSRIVLQPSKYTKRLSKIEQTCTTLQYTFFRICSVLVQIINEVHHRPINKQVHQFLLNQLSIWNTQTKFLQRLCQKCGHLLNIHS